MKSFTQVIATILFVGFVQANPPNFDYDFIGFTKLTQMLATSCDDIEGQVSSFCTIFFFAATFRGNF